MATSGKPRLGSMDSKAYYDTQPDIFTFNFLGYSGNFQLGPGNKIHVYNTNFPSGEIQIDYAPFPDYGIMPSTSSSGASFMRN